MVISWDSMESRLSPFLSSAMESAMVVLLVSSIAVFAVPKYIFSSFRRSVKISGVSGTKNRIEEKHPAKEEQFGKKKDPHPHLCSCISGMVCFSCFDRLIIANHIYTARVQ